MLNGYQSTTLSDGSLVDVDMLTLGAANLDVFAGINGDDETNKIGLTLANASFALALMSDRSNANRTWTGLKASADAAAFVGISDVTLNANALSAEVNQTTDANALVVDFASVNLEVATGASSTLTLDMDGARGELSRLNANVELNAYNFFSVSGGFALEKSTNDVIVNDGTNVNVDMLTLGANDVNAFVGVNGNSAERVGFLAKNVNFALAILSERGNGANQWITLQANVGSVSFEGIDGITLSSSDLKVNVNRAAGDASLVDYVAKNLEVTTSTTTTLTLDIDGQRGELLEASGTLNINVYDFFTIEGGFALEKSTKMVTLSDGSVIQTDFLSLGAVGVSAFAGLNGGGVNALGLELSAVDFALAFYVNQADVSKKYASLQASAAEISFVGLAEVTMAGSDLKIEINQADASGFVIDYAAQSVEVTVATNEIITLDMDGQRGELLQASGTLNVNVYNFFSLDGGFGLEKSTKQVTLSDSEVISVDMLSVGASDVTAFAGLNGGKSNAIGLSLSQLSFALALMSDKSNSARKFTALQATAGSVGFIGVDGITISSDTVEVKINQSNTNDVVDFATSPLDIVVGTGTTITLDMDGSVGKYLEADRKSVV